MKKPEKYRVKVRIYRENGDYAPFCTQAAAQHAALELERGDVDESAYIWFRQTPRCVSTAEAPTENNR